MSPSRARADGSMSASIQRSKSEFQRASPRARAEEVNRRMRRQVVPEEFAQVGLRSINQLLAVYRTS